MTPYGIIGSISSISSISNISNISNVSSICLGHESACMASIYCSIMPSISISSTSSLAARRHYHHQHHHRRHAISRAANSWVCYYRERQRQRLVSVGRRSFRSLTNCQAFYFIPRTTPANPSNSANPGPQISQLPARRQWSSCLHPTLYL